MSLDNAVTCKLHAGIFDDLPPFIKANRVRYWPIFAYDHPNTYYGFIDTTENRPENIPDIPLPDGKHYLEPIFLALDHRYLLVEKKAYRAESEVIPVQVCIYCSGLMSKNCHNLNGICPLCLGD